MIHLPASVRVYLSLSPCDMRRSFDGLHALVRDHLELDAFAGHLYLFANRRKVIEDVCKKYPCGCTVKTAAKPAQPIEKSTAGASMRPQ
jgi:transposase